jgi:3-mercaptopyruvate sulfurtransferase SseA
MATATVASCIALMAGCGGGSGTYEAPDSTASSAPAWWSTYAESAETLVTADTAADWIRNGYRTVPSGKAAVAGAPVLVLDVQTDFTDATKNRIIGSTSVSSIEAFTIFDYRAEGPIDTSGIQATSSKMVPKGATMDAMLQDMGVTKDTVILLTSSSSGNGVWNLTRGWWMLHYWGLSEANVKVLDGGVEALAIAAPDLVNTTAESVDPADSTFSVKDLPAINTSARVSTVQLMDMVKKGTAVVIDARGGSVTSKEATQGRIKDAIVAGTAGIDGGSLVNADGTFKSKTDMEAIFNAAGVTEDKQIVVHCYSGYSATPIYYYIKEVLEYDNVALYDGSWSAWASHVGFTAKNAYANAGNTVAWDGIRFLDKDAADAPVDAADITLGGPLQTDTYSAMMKYDTARYSGDIKFNADTAWKDSYGNVLYTVDTDYNGTGTEIATEDAAYIASDDNPDTATPEDDNTDIVAQPDNSGC